MSTPYELLGGDAAVRALVDRFYDLMDTAPEAKDVRGARRTIDELVKAYPQSEAAAAGKERLASLK
jgi:outer membrane protein assembly factor BamD (BamD/ComL family)